jgi:hypothetical protein
MVMWIIFGVVFFVLALGRGLGLSNRGPKWLNGFIQGER